MNYTFCISIINTHIYVGGTVLLTKRMVIQSEFWKFFKENNCTSLSGVPYTYEMLKRLKFVEKELPSLRTLTQAGGKMSSELHREYAEWAERKGCRFVIMYGACEATARMGWLPPEKAVEKIGAMGIPIPGGRFEVIDECGVLIDVPFKVGELVYYGKNVTLGYAVNASDLIKGDERNGRYLTGDMAFKDAEGFYYIVGRKKRFIKMYGNSVNLDDCENLLKQKFGDIELACGGIDDLLYIFVSKSEQLMEIEKYLAKKIGFNSSSFKIVLLDVIPRNANGKILYKDLEQYYE